MENVQNPQPQVSRPQEILKRFTPTAGRNNKAFLIGISVIVVLIGIGSGYLFSGKKLSFQSLPTVPGSKTNTMEAGIVDEKTFKDTATGILREGGVKGEGTHHLERDGGDSQNVYLTSTVIDLQSFVGKKVQAWGQTISGKNAGWLMDVGKVKVVE
ncbi:MAG: hypothetical protein AAB656_02960 [Patescibacteria group bacterium]